MKTINSYLYRCILIVVFILGIPFSCRDKDDNEIPYVHVDYTIDILSTFYTELSAVNGYVYISGGYKGILIYRFSVDEFLAYDRCCSYRPKEPCEIIKMESSGITMKDSCCGSRFNIIDGSPINGPATKVLRQYRTQFDGKFLRIFN